MCLSSVYKKSGTENVFMLKNIARVEPDGEKITFTDLMGVRTEIKGKILDIDLMENIIIIEGKES